VLEGEGLRVKAERERVYDREEEGEGLRVKAERERVEGGIGFEQRGRGFMTERKRGGFQGRGPYELREAVFIIVPASKSEDL
jgi:hypothetical protein